MNYYVPKRIILCELRNYLIEDLNELLINWKILKTLIITEKNYYVPKRNCRKIVDFNYNGIFFVNKRCSNYYSFKIYLQPK